MNLILHMIIIALTTLFFTCSVRAEGYTVLNNSDGTPVEAIVVYTHTDASFKLLDYHYYRGVVAINSATKTHDIIITDYLKQGFKTDYPVFIRTLQHKRFKTGDDFKIVFLDRKLGQVEYTGTCEDGYMITITDVKRNPVISSKQLVMFQAPLGKLDDTKNVKVKYKPTEKKVTLDELIASVPKSK